MPFTDVGVTRVRWTRTGSGAPVVLLHGLGGDVSFWEGEISVLAESFDVIAIDLRGSGWTPASPGGHTIADLAEDVRAVLDDAGVRRAHVVGFSTGGLVAQDLAVMHPDRVGRVVLASAYARMGRQARLFLDAVLDVHRNGASAQQVFDLIVPWLFSAAFAADPVNASYLSVPAQAGGDTEDWPASYEAQRAFDGTGRLARISAEVLVIGGGQDHLVPLDDMLALETGIPGARLHVVPDAGHLVNVEAPMEFRNVIRNFLEPEAPR